MFRVADAHTKGPIGDMIRVYHATGCRTHELLNARVCDFQPRAGTLVLGKHKRTHTLREPVPRVIPLNAGACGIIRRRCEWRPNDGCIFVNRNGDPYSRSLIDHRFATIREQAGVRPHLTIYSFRHVWISDMLAAGVDALLVARMAGTSVAMIERVYGHFRTSSTRDALARLDSMRRGSAP